MNAKIDPAAYNALLNTIAQGESEGNYNAYFGNSANQEILFTSMSIAQVQQWQKEFIRQGSPSNAVGKYQIIGPTLSGLVEQMRLDTSQKFDPAVQDKMAITLLERRGSKDFATNKITQQEFAANLAKEWAALPRVTGPNPEQSYYAGDGLNKVQISVSDIYAALATFKTFLSY